LARVAKQLGSLLLHTIVKLQTDRDGNRFVFRHCVTIRVTYSNHKLLSYFAGSLLLDVTACHKPEMVHGQAVAEAPLSVTAGCFKCKIHCISISHWCATQKISFSTDNAFESSTIRTICTVASLRTSLSIRFILVCITEHQNTQQISNWTRLKITNTHITS